MLMRYIGLQFSYVLAWFWYQGNTGLQNELGSILYSSVFLKSMCVLNKYCFFLKCLGLGFSLWGVLNYLFIHFCLCWVLAAAHGLSLVGVQDLQNTRAQQLSLSCGLAPRHVGSQFPYQGTESMSPAAAAAKSLQSCPTLCDPIDSSPPGSSVPGILQARVLEWGAIASCLLHWKANSQPLDHQRSP